MGQIMIRSRQRGTLKLRLGRPPFGEVVLQGATVANYSTTPPTPAKEFGETPVDEEWWEAWKAANIDSSLIERHIIWKKGEKGPWENDPSDPRNRRLRPNAGLPPRA